MINKEFWKEKKVLLTGHTGFKGSWLSIWLHELGANVCGYSLEPNTEPSLFKLANIEQLVQSNIGDIGDLKRLQQVFSDFQPEIVIHMAAQPLVRESYDNPVDTYSTNVMGTVNVLECIRHCKSVKAVVNVTTDKVYENKEWAWGYREVDRLGGYDPYSNSKACSELVTSSYLNSFFNPETYAEHGIAIATARAGNVIGGGDWSKDRLIPDVIRALENNEEIIIRNPNAVRPWQHVLEPLSGYLMLAEKLYLEGVKWNGAWNFGPDDSNCLSVGELLSEIQIFEPHLNLKLGEGRAKHEASLLMLDNSKAKKTLLWHPNLRIENTLKWTLDLYFNLSLDSIKKQLKEYEILGEV